MAKIPLTSGAYQSRSIIANAQRCLNLFPEANPQETSPPVPVTHYPRPGKKVFSIPPEVGRGRGLYRATNGDLYTVVGPTLYFVNSLTVWSAIGNIGANNSIVSMSDNGESVGNKMVVVDGSVNGWTVTLSTKVFAPIVDPTGTFVGSNTVNYLSGFFLFNAPNTPYWYISELNVVTFNSLDVASKNAYADNIAIVGVRQREAWLVGELTTEPWYLSGASTFPFEAVSTTFVSYGCIAKYSQITLDSELFWISQDLKGRCIVVKSSGYKVERISNHAIENTFQSYTNVSDAVGSSYQVQGHEFYVLTFPSADATWQYDVATKQWSQLCWLDEDGVEHRDRAMLYVNAYDRVIAQDWENGTLYIIDVDTYTDNGDQIKFLRSFPHVLDEMKRITHWSLVVDMECGTESDEDVTAQLNMRYSDDRGKSYSDYLVTSMGKIGEYLISPQFTRLGQCRDRVYEISWGAEGVKTALNGAYILTEESET